MKSLIPFPLTVIGYMAIALSGCSRSPRYQIAMVNRTSHVFEGVAVYFDGRMAAEKGHLVNGGEATFGILTLPLPEEAEVRWIDESKNPDPEPQTGNDYSAEAVARIQHWVNQGEHHSPKVKLRGVVPDNPDDGIIHFIIEEDGSVTVKWTRSGDIDGRIDATKGIKKFRDKQ